MSQVTYSMRGRNKERKKHETPGPGSYEYTPGFDKRTPTTQNSVRFRQKSQETPGPGTYGSSTIHLQKSARPVFGSQ